MDGYRDKVRRFAKERTGESFYNNSPAHAAVILESLLETARGEICLISSALNPDVFGQSCVLDAGSNFLKDPNHRLKILLEIEPNEIVSTEHPFASKIGRRNNVEMRRLPSYLRENLEYHFAVADADSFRFEPDKTKWEASAAFGDELNGKKLQDVYDAIWRESTQTHLNV